LANPDALVTVFFAPLLRCFSSQSFRSLLSNPINFQPFRSFDTVEKALSIDPPMAKITLDIPDELCDQLAQAGDRLPELLRLSLQQPAIPAHIYRYILDFLSSQPTPDDIIAFRPTPEMTERLQTLIIRAQAGTITPSEQQELDEYDRIEHLIIMLKAGSLSYLTKTE
jgi:hypothetical protein